MRGMKRPRFPRGLRPRYSLRMLFAFVTILAILLGLVVRQLKVISDRRAEREWVTTTKLAKIGWWEATASTKVPWLRRLLGDGLQVLYIDVYEEKLSPEEMYHVQKLRRLFPEAKMWVHRSDGNTDISGPTE